MASIIKSMEANEVGIQQCAQEFFPDRQSPVDLRGGERTVKKKSKLYPIKSFSQESGKDHEMIIMNPDKIIIRVYHFEEFISEELVDGDVGLPEKAVKAATEVRREGKHIVEERPEVLFAKTVVKASAEIGRDECRNAFEGLEKGLGDLVLIGKRDLVAEATDVDELHVGVGSDGVFELEEERVLVPGKGPGGGAGAGEAVGADGELVGDDDGAFASGTGGGVGIRVIEVGDDAGDSHDTRDAPADAGERRWLAGDQIEKIRV